MASSRNCRKRRHSPVNYKQFHETGRTPSSESTESTDDPIKADFESESTSGYKKAKERSTPFPDGNGNASGSAGSPCKGTEETNDSSTFKKNEQTDKCKTTNGASTATGTEFDDGLPRFYSRPRNERSNPMYDTYFSSDTDDNDSGDDVVSNSNNETDGELQTGNAEMDVEDNSQSHAEENVQEPNTTVNADKLSVGSAGTSSVAGNSSEHWRTLGNKIYVTASKNLSPFIQKERLTKASGHYYKALNFSQSEGDTVSASKNLGMVSWRIAELENRLSTMTYFFKEAFKYFSFSWRDSSNGVKPQSWRDGVFANATACLECFKLKIADVNIEERLKIFTDIIDTIRIENVKCSVYIELGSCLFHQAVYALQNNDFKKAIYVLKETFFPLNETKRIGKGVTVIEAEARILEEDVFMHSCMAESIQAREIGDGIFRKVLLDEEKLNMDMVYEMIDWYKQAILRTREVTEVELEAIALSRMGRVYDKILKLKYKAKEYLMRSIQLAHSMHPRTFHGEDWFKECSDILERYQRETVQEEDSKWQKEKEELMKELSKEMKDIEKNDKKDSEDFLKFVYRVFPPKNPEHKLLGIPRKKGVHLDSPVLKKILQKAIVHFHPDRVNADKHGKAWKVIAEEITKCLTRRYECLK
ncbi:uncharacterized protein LOC134707306 [Mytilus trossulus]|uniref:uncharacterized protein LOC134707306 n=1 Tax=Mytilus trossulus TaxID=6551 RepID=UPI0030055E30